MALTDLEELREALGDTPVPTNDSDLGDGSATIFQLPSFPVTAGSETVFVSGVEQTDPTDYSLDDDLGRLTFVSAPADQAVIIVVGTATQWSDTRLNDILDRAGSVTAAALEAIEWKIAQLSNVSSFTAGDVEVDNRVQLAALKALHDYLDKKLKQDAIGSGQSAEWATEQANF
jgi:hypothetical protein